MITGEEIANNIRAERVRFSLNTEEVSSKLGISRQTYNAYEKNANGIRISTLLKLANLFNCSIDTFFIKR